eukprot:CAMPEP_0118948646 /NCGR_PEP_ID=MMETSP1169-20130426/48200_1 /TAXON_ID=36882 /ORGANISM="Pyramimonas obovata, Strain CCMP722" /LENGTH=270 /DNA_ID=CAMNT_0006895129 /DNA_START=159 /DNA_END=971 /DNA_ORIENTATION=+
MSKDATLKRARVISTAAECTISTKTFTYGKSPSNSEEQLHAYAAWPADAVNEGKRLPGVLVGHTAIGWQEEFIYERCKAVASLGYYALAFDMFGGGELLLDPVKRKPKMDLINNDRNNLVHLVTQAYKEITSQPEVDADKIGGVGYCLGGKAMLDLARSGLPVRGVVSFHGILDSPQLDQHPPVKAKVLVLHGHQDPFSPKENIDAFVEEMERKEVDWQMHSYGGTLHGFTRPDKTTEKDRQAGFQTSPLNEKRSWASTVAFLSEVFADE